MNQIHMLMAIFRSISQISISDTTMKPGDAFIASLSFSPSVVPSSPLWSYVVCWQRLSVSRRCVRGFLSLCDTSSTQREFKSQTKNKTLMMPGEGANREKVGTF